MIRSKNKKSEKRVKDKLDDYGEPMNYKCKCGVEHIKVCNMCHVDVLSKLTLGTIVGTSMFWVIVFLIIKVFVWK